MINDIIAKAGNFKCECGEDVSYTIKDKHMRSKHHKDALKKTKTIGYF